jgi:hypothetical protein
VRLVGCNLYTGVLMTTRNTKGHFTGRTDSQKAKEARAEAFARAMVETGSEREARYAEAAVRAEQGQK